jgi:hypothetical protein
MPPRMNVKREPKSAIAKDAALFEAGLVLSRHADAWRIYDIRYRVTMTLAAEIRRDRGRNSVIPGAVGARR